MGGAKTAAQVITTLAAVAAIYGVPWVLAAAGAAFEPDWDLASEPVQSERVVTLPADLLFPDEQPPGEADDPAEPGDEVSDDAVADAASEPPSAAPTAASPGSPVAATPVLDGATVDPSADRAQPKLTSNRRRRTTRARRATHTPRELTKKQQRRVDRRKRQRERMAKQPQCHELIDQIVPVAEDEWYIGQDLAGCYRAHPRQFARMGGMRWEEDKDGKRLGLRIYVSSRARGDVARAVGFQRGDVLRSLNGIPLRSTAGSGFAMMGLLGSKAKVKFLRDGEEHKVTLRVVGKNKLAKARAKAEERARAEALAATKERRRGPRGNR